MEKSIEIAKKMLAKKMTIEEIVELTGLTEEEIKDLKEE
jgi:predicted transposase YdaD